MINVLLSYYNAILGNTGFFEINFGLAEKVCDDLKTFYAIYNSSEGYALDNQDFSGYKGLSYWFLRREISNNPEPDPNKAGKLLNRMNFPLSLICVIPRNLVGQDCSTTSVDVLQQIASEFTVDTKELRRLLGATEVNYGSQAWITDRKQILSSQYIETGPRDVDYQYHYFQLNFDLEIVIPSDCLHNICED